LEEFYPLDWRNGSIGVHLGVSTFTGGTLNIFDAG